MEKQADAVFATMHHRVTGELLHLMDGLYSNVEDGLFELAYQARDEAEKRRCFDLMRDLRYQRSRLVQSFTRRLQAGFAAWLRGTAAGEGTDVARHARRLAQKPESHFRSVLQELAERCEGAMGRQVTRDELPMGPRQLASHFITCMRALKFDEPAIGIVDDLFSRFVLQRLGSVYGECNARLARAGFLTRVEREARDDPASWASA